MHLPSVLPFTLLVVILHFTTALPQARTKRSVAGASVPLVRRAQKGRTTDEEKAAWALRQANKLKSKYSKSNAATSHPPASPSKRASGTNELVNHDQDSSYFGSLVVGTPAQPFNVILDTGSADMWIASSTCTKGCFGVPAFASSNSNTFSNLTTSFKIQYGSGEAQGVLAKDVVQMAGFSVPQQTFGVVSTVSTGLLTNPVSGLLGLGFQAIASSGALPFWQTLVESNAWDEPLMSFYLTRFINATDVSSQEPGGRFTMGFVDSSLYTGDVQYTPIPQGQQGYWTLPLTGVTVNGHNITLPGTAASSFSAIDTGTTLIGGPAALIAEIFSAIPDSQPATGDFEGYYTYSCDRAVSVSLSFGGGTFWTINPEDFMLMPLTNGNCLGAFFALGDMGPNAPSWIVGDTFLKNVYSVFRYSPPSVGFAELSISALNLAVAGGPLPSQTIASNPTLATLISAASSSSSGKLTSTLLMSATALLFILS